MATRTKSHLPSDSSSVLMDTHTEPVAKVTEPIRWRTVWEPAPVKIKALSSTSEAQGVYEKYRWVD